MAFVCICLSGAEETHAQAQARGQSQTPESSQEEPRSADTRGTTTTPEKKRQTGLDVSGSIGGAIRLGDAPLFDVTRRGGMTYGLGLAYLLHPVSIGVTYEHTGLGLEESGVSPFGAVHIDRSIDTVWASLKIRLSGLQPIAPFLGASLGATWQYAHATGVFLIDGGLRGTQSFSCSARDSLNLALRAGGGLEVPVSNGLSVMGEATFDAYRLSSEVLENCVPGAGAATAILLRVGLLYRFDWSESR